jgi:hypothetical protein
MMRLRKTNLPLAMLTVILLLPFITGSDYLSRDQIPKGTDRPSYRCDNGLVSRGDLIRDVLAKCGEPMQETRIQLEPYRVWIYPSESGEYIVYMAFTNERLNRIYVARCWEENPHCD